MRPHGARKYTQRAVPSVGGDDDGTNGRRRNGVFRVLPEMFTSPTVGNYLPGNLTEFAEVFDADGSPKFSVDRLTFRGPGVSSYEPDCDFELLRPVQ
jgi:hypothetical protein